MQPKTEICAHRSEIGSRSVDEALLLCPQAAFRHVPLSQKSLFSGLDLADWRNDFRKISMVAVS